MGYQCHHQENTNMASAPTVLLRASIVLMMVAAVVTILYFTPMPDQMFKSCDRPCHELDWPMICRLKLTLEMYQTMSGVCQDCPSNSTHCENKFCASADGSARGIITANRQLPGPSIQVCQGDILVIDVINKIPGHSVTVHWRGQPNHEAPFMDGVPMITQCPISSFTTFQYKFRASQPGTHFYHAFADSDRSDGFFGSLIVRQADKVEPHRKLYDIDDKDHVVLISEWSGDLSTDSNLEDDLPKALLINGKTPTEGGSSMSSFSVKKSKRYRFRLAYTGGILGCPVTFSIDNHLLKIIALDGKPTQPYEVSSVKLTKGERLDFVLKATQEIGAYFVRASSNCNKNELQGLAIINYEGYEKTVFKMQNKLGAGSGKLREFDTAICDTRLGKVCLNDVRSLLKMPKELRKEEVDRKIYIGYDFKTGSKEKNEGGFVDLRSKIYRMNNLTFTYPPSPLLTQPDDVPLALTCNELNIPEKCTGKHVCECVHVEHIPLGSTTELILFDQAGDEEEHVFHMHGYHLYVVGVNTFDSLLTKDDIKKLDSLGKLVKRNLVNPVVKDTVRVPKNGVVVLRFTATNPGFWILHDEQSRSWTRGLDIVLQVGHTSEMVPTPTNFPTCGNFIGPDFFLV